MITEKWTDLLDLEPKFNELLSSFGVAVPARHRFTTAFELVQELEDARKAGTTDSIEGSRMGNMRFALNDIGDLQRIVTGIQHYPGDTSILAAKLRKILEGSNSRTDESQGNSEPRNIQFELVLLGDLLRAGVKALLREPNPDIEAHAGGHIYSIECKRVFANNDRSVRDRVASALKQTLKTIGNDQHRRGVVAIAIERRLTGGDSILVAKNEKVARARLELEIEQFINNYCRYWLGKAITTPRQVGVLVFANVSGSLEDEGIIVNATQLGMTNTSHGIYAESLFKDFANDIGVPLQRRADTTRSRFIT